MTRIFTMLQSSKTQRRGTLLLALGLGLGLGSGGCIVRAQPAVYAEDDGDYDADGYYVDGAYADVYAAPAYVYGGVQYYWYNDYWWYRNGNRWVVLHSEPRGLYRYRTEHWGHRGGYGRSPRPYRPAPAYRAPARPRPAHRHR